MKELSVSVLLVIILGMFLLQCNLPKQFVGERIGYNHPYFCTIDNFPKSCTIKTDFFMFDFTISTGDKAGEFYVTGGARHQGASSFGYLLVGGMGESKFYLLLAKNGVIIDSITVLPLGDSLSHRIPFKKTFKCEPFDAVGITYDVVFRG